MAINDDVLKRKGRESLFDDDDTMFRGAVAECTVYGEYGCGGSTVWVAKNSDCAIYAVDSNPEWIAHVKNRAGGGRVLNLYHADIGPVGNWGHPTGYTKRDNFPAYTDWLWQQAEKPDLILIDGRFRVCCFLTCLKYAEAGTRIIVDDYTIRPHYHIVEEFLPPAEICGEQAMFTVPAKSEIDLEKVAALIERFRFVFE